MVAGHQKIQLLTCLRIGGDTINVYIPDSKVRGAHMGLIWGQQDPGGPHVGPMNFATWGCIHMVLIQHSCCFVIAEKDSTEYVN